MKLIARSVIALAILLAPALASAAVSFSIFASSGGGACTSPICVVGDTIIGVINGVLVPLLFAIAFIVFLYGIVSAYIFHAGDAEAVKNGHRLILWGIIGFAVMVSLWGLVNIVADTFGLQGAVAPLPPTSY